MERALTSIQNGWNKKESYFYNLEDDTYFNCNIYLHQAKIRPGSDVTGLCDPKIRVTFLNCQKESKVLYQTLSPIWNEIIKFENLRFPGKVEYYVDNPPLVALELYDIDTKTSSDYLGCTLLRLTVKPINMEKLIPFKILFEKVENEGDINLESLKPKEIEKLREFTTQFFNDENDEQFSSIIKTKVAIQKLKDISKIFPPPLKWQPIVCDGTILAEILVSGELIELQTPTQGSSTLINIELHENIPKEILPIMSKYK